MKQLTLAVLFAAIGMTLGVAQSFAEESAPKVELKIFSAEWCGPCKVLKKEMKKEGVLKSFKVRADKGLRQISVAFVDLTDASPAEKKAAGKLLEPFPEEVLIVDGKVLARDFYSDFKSIENFVIKTLNEKRV